MKKLMQDHGHENFIKTVSNFIEKRKNISGLENRVFPTRNKKNSIQYVTSSKFAHDIYSGNDTKTHEDDHRSPSVSPSLTPRQPFVLHRQGSDLSIIQEKIKKIGKPKNDFGGKVSPLKMANTT